MASGSHECQFPGCDSMTHANGLPLALFSRGVAFDLKRRRRHAAPHESRHQLGGTPARANAEAGGSGPAAAMANLLPAADDPHICSRISLVPELRAVPLLSSGRTHLAVQLTVADPASSPVSGLNMASSAGMSTWKSACHLEMRAGCQRMITSRSFREAFRSICNLENISLGFALIHDPEPAVLPVTRIVRC
jgi:hypothetical protein